MKNESQIVTELASLALSEIFGVPVCLVEAKTVNENPAKQCNNLNKDANLRNQRVPAHAHERQCNANQCPRKRANGKQTNARNPKNMTRLERQAYNIATAPIDHVIYNAPATIVFWKDGSKTVVCCDKYDKYDAQAGLALAICKKVMGNQEFHDIFEHFLPDEVAHPELLQSNDSDVSDDVETTDSNDSEETNFGWNTDFTNENKTDEPSTDTE